jgi:adenine-specific DNA-methyltransferase
MSIWPTTIRPTDPITRNDELEGALIKNGDVVDVIELDYKRNVMAGMKWTNAWIRDAQDPNREFLFLIDKG